MHSLIFNASKVSKVSESIKTDAFPLKVYVSKYILFNIFLYF